MKIGAQWDAAPWDGLEVGEVEVVKGEEADDFGGEVENAVIVHDLVSIEVNTDVDGVEVDDVPLNEVMIIIKFEELEGASVAPVFQDLRGVGGLGDDVGFEAGAKVAGCVGVMKDC